MYRIVQQVIGLIQPTIMAALNSHLAPPQSQQPADSSGPQRRIRDSITMQGPDADGFTETQFAQLGANEFIIGDDCTGLTSRVAWLRKAVTNSIASAYFFVGSYRATE